MRTATCVCVLCCAVMCCAVLCYAWPYIASDRSVSPVLMSNEVQAEARGALSGALGRRCLLSLLSTDVLLPGDGVGLGRTDRLPSDRLQWTRSGRKCYVSIDSLRFTNKK